MRGTFIFGQMSRFTPNVASQLNFMVKFYAILAIYAILAEFYGQI